MTASALIAEQQMMPPADLRGINQVASELGVTTRTIRFYEDKGLVEPQRVGMTRIYTRREYARLQLILRGKRLGFSLREIKEFLDLYDADSFHLEQTRKLAERVHERLTTLRKQRAALEQTIDELEEIEQQALARIKSLR
ncbi:MerR family transcriptional regulator [Sphingomonas oleivorans]|uniref:MerR family transcriptional regulator n=1 Tax=Sphingomonas oleivorans TaxID=1735121 RepID=A0A2T5G0B3_9SPHN|nr:MerR family DNA-binding transcriptional regulator [Sphingomonas oleivorans]PTQ12378.1 MerR family transcriptional regulator [Sphingomonas oleivorans]